MRFISLDTETTGLTESDEIVELSFVIFVKSSIIMAYSSLIKSKKSISIPARLVNGIEDAIVLNQGKDLKETLDFFISHIHKDDILIGNRIDFDLFFINKALKEFNLPVLKNSYVCIHKLHEQVLTEPFHLSDIASFYGFQFPLKHRALSDALTTALIFQKTIDRLQNFPLHGKADTVKFYEENSKKKS